MRRNRIRISGRIVASFCLLVTLLLVVAGASLAWLVDMMRPSPREDFFASSIASYFAGGDGKTPETAYRIEDPVHLYNLAWLQNMGQFNKPDDPIKTYYFEIANASHGAIVLDMAGKLAGAGGTKTGAIPPIGTKQYPFQGVLDGKGSVIQNLWVSTHHDDWQEHPANMETYQSTHVGLFGAADTGAVITNFNVDRIEVTTHYSATVGILCGYANANISDVGVYNGILDFRNSEIEVNSEYTLLGELGADVAWGDKPTVGGGSEGDEDDEDDAGGEIIIDPNNVYLVEGSATKTMFSPSMLTDGYMEVTGTIPYTAYYTSALEVTTKSGNNKVSIWDRRNGTNAPFTQSTSEHPEIWQAYQNLKSGSTFIAPKLSVAYIDEETGEKVVRTTTVPKNAAGDEITVPANAIWFKPEQYGTAALAFTQSTKNKERYMSVYKFERISDDQIKLLSETEFILPSSVNNGDIVYYEYEILKEDVMAHYEYAIGVSTRYNNSDQQAGFFMMVLAGTNVENGETPGGDGGGGGSDNPTYSISDIDYIVSSGVNVGAADYAIHQVIFTLSGKTVSAGKITYLAWSDGKVYYQIDPTTLGLVVQDVAGNGIGASSTTNDDVDFEDRKDVATTSGGS